jgi:hypothetical protein
MNERLIVKNFLCLKYIDIEVKDFLILIGPQATGKSLCAKLLYFFRTLLEEIARYQIISVLGKPTDINTELSGKFESFFPKTYWVEQEFCIEYKSGDKPICTITRKNEELELNINQGILMASQEITHVFQKSLKNNPEKYRDVLRILPDIFIRHSHNTNIFIPAGRSFFSLLQKNIFGFLRTSNTIDPIIMEFGIFYDEIKQTGHDIPTEVQTLIHSILKGDYVYADEMLQFPDGSNCACAIVLRSAGCIAAHACFCPYHFLTSF